MAEVLLERLHLLVYHNRPIFMADPEVAVVGGLLALQARQAAVVAPLELEEQELYYICEYHGVKMKYVYTFAGIFMVLFGTHLFVYQKAFNAGRNEVLSELQETAQAQAVALKDANKKILDFYS